MQRQRPSEETVESLKAWTDGWQPPFWMAVRLFPCEAREGHVDHEGMWRVEQSMQGRAWFHQFDPHEITKEAMHEALNRFARQVIREQDESNS